jgi:hypothetical protein
VPRKKRQLKRDAGMMRDTKLIIIASEDIAAVSQYVSLFHSTRIRFVVLETVDGRSAPEHVLSRIQDHRKKNESEPYDEFWLVCDTDHWIKPDHIQNLVAVLSECRRQLIRVALSKPCFDVWLLMHFADLPDETVNCRKIGELIRENVGQFNKLNLDDLRLTTESVQAAIARAQLAPVGIDTIPQHMGSAVDKIISQLLAEGIISL